MAEFYCLDKIVGEVAVELLENSFALLLAFFRERVGDVLICDLTPVSDDVVYQQKYYVADSVQHPKWQT